MADNNSLAFNPLGLFKRVDTQAATRHYQNRQVIFAQGDKADAMFYIQDGSVKLTVMSTSGKKAVIAILRQGDFFGEGCLVKQSLRVSTATAIQSSTIARVEKAPLARVIQQEPAFAKLFIAYLLSRIGRVEEELVDQISNSSEMRLARILLLLAGVGLQSKPTEPVILKVSQETLAEMVGTTRSRVSHFMNRFRKMGLIDYNGSLRVHRALLTFCSTSKEVLPPRQRSA
ncbi:MAG: Crp/Fnr family transcriptional regulator [Candidatus Korobacteraceae bacterium]|jgi:CRP-like cAMP-binding protein